MSKIRGLPPEKRMRHDSHYVDVITSERTDSVGRLIEIDRIEPNPHQPRKDFGDLGEMVASVKEKGILEPILVRSHDGRYQIIAGERRYQAAKIAGLLHVPCIEVDVDSRGMLEISLIENLQRKDLSAFEEAAAIHNLAEQFRYTHEEIARKLGKSRPVITEALSLNRMPEDVQERCRRADISSKSMLLQIVRQESVDEMHGLIDKITGEGFTRDDARRFGQRETGRRSRPRNFVFRYRPENDAFRFSVRFEKSEVHRNDLIQALREVLETLLKSEGDPHPGGGPEAEVAGRDATGSREGHGSAPIEWPGVQAG